MPRAVRDHTGFRAIAATRAAKRLTCISLRRRSPFSRRPGSFRVRADVGAVEERHAECDTLRLCGLQQALPHAKPGPADEGLRRGPPRTQLCRDGAPLGAVLVPPDDGFDGPAQVVVPGLAARAALFDQGRQLRPLCIRKNLHLASYPPRTADRGTPQELTGPSVAADESHGHAATGDLSDHQWCGTTPTTASAGQMRPSLQW